MAASWLDGLLIHLTFGHSSPQAAIAYLAIDHDPADATLAMKKLVKRLQAFAAGERHDDFLDVPLFMTEMTPFQQAVVERCRRIPPGETLSYAGLAAAAGHPGAARAVGRVMATNRFPLIVPCHRVVAAGGAIGGFSAPDGINMKRRLLAPEQAIHQCE
ncbi:MAG: methylated-DNA--[protein]-cysteine S-methyltransferase [Planctomycetota bacterium]|nr:methylated-DNA--[protein]-cysteine S-methyltransferase [Planctomycetota bacterium]